MNVIKQMKETNQREQRWWIVLAILAVVYHVVIFALPFPKTPVFFLSWIFTVAALAAQVYVIRTAFFRGEGVKSKFYGFPIVRIGVMYLLAQIVLGLVFMALGAILPFWIPLVLFVVLIGAAAIGLVAADAVREEIERQDIRQERNTEPMRKFRARVNMLVRENPIPEASQALEHLAESFRFSDPVSSEELLEIEDRLAEDLAQLQDAMALLKTNEALELCRKTERDLAARNQLCKASKKR